MCDRAHPTGRSHRLRTSTSAGSRADPTRESAPSLRGTFAGLVEKIPYLKDLGITIVELMPVFQCDPQEGSSWGYMPLNFFAPHEGYASKEGGFGPCEELGALGDRHAADIEVVLDVVYSHTAEGDQRGPIYSFKGIDNSSYYLLSGNPAPTKTFRARATRCTAATGTSAP